VPAVLDVVYDPWPTPLAARCRGVVVSGAAMLLHQAAEQVRLMTGRPAPLDAMRQALAGRLQVPSSDRPTQR
jgi:shikimate dehydrogenase